MKKFRDVVDEGSGEVQIGELKGHANGNSSVWGPLILAAKQTELKGYSTLSSGS